MRRIVNVPGTCGEFVQGYLDGEPVLASCPIDRYSSVSVTRVSGKGIQVLTPDCNKTYEAVMRAVELVVYDEALGFDVEIIGQLPRSRGYASSTADITAAITAIFDLSGCQITPQAIGRIACAIEPSDSIMFPEWSLFAYRSGDWNIPVGHALKLPMIILDTAHKIDTLAYNRNLDIRKVANLKAPTRQAFDLLIEGCQSKDISCIGEAARISACAYQAVEFSPLLDAALKWSKALQAFGPVRAHSGSIVGLLFLTDEEAIQAVNWLGSRFDGEISIAHTVGGGAEVVECQK